jgi:hypothetical protein
MGKPGAQKGASPLKRPSVLTPGKNDRRLLMRRYFDRRKTGAIALCDLENAALTDSTNVGHVAGVEVCMIRHRCRRA